MSHGLLAGPGLWDIVNSSILINWETLMRDFTKYDVTHEARQLAVKIYSIVQYFPQEERYALSQQMRRAVVSIGANIAEGAGRKTEKDFAHFLTQSMGSTCELEYLTILSLDLNYINEGTWQSVDSMIQRVKKMLFRFRNSIYPG
ncbi:MAG: four helix bundle protein [Bacteroidetes bacterium]|nr:four helix bundle protein [Bacteroidota bacterium]